MTLTDLEEILGEIEYSASQEAEEILEQARAEAGSIISEARAEAERQASGIESETERRVAEIKRSGESARQRSKREAILEVKQEVIAAVIQKTKEKLYELPDDEYFTLLAELASSCAIIGEGAVMFNAADRKRLPQDFEQKLGDMLPNGAKLRISEETRPVDGGLILEYNGVEQNCSFEAIFNARCDEFSDMIRGMMFTEQE
jgi:V/A-type H+-transporting ATPase subunit E